MTAAKAKKAALENVCELIYAFVHTDGLIDEFSEGDSDMIQAEMIKIGLILFKRSEKAVAS